MTTNRRKTVALERILVSEAAPVELTQSPVYIMPEAAQEFIKVTLHSEKLKFGHKPSRTGQIDVFDLLDSGEGKSIEAREEDKELAREQGLTVIGLDFSLAQNKALHAVQTLLSRTDYQGNMPQRYISDPNNVFAFTGTLPVLKFSVSEYLDAFGVTKYQTKRGKMEYASAEREEALKALRDLEKPVIMVYNRVIRRDQQNRLLHDAIRTVRPLLNIVEGFRDLTEAELEGIQQGASGAERLSHIVIEPSVVLVDQVNKYFVLKPANLYQELRIKFGKTDKKLALFIEYLLAKAADYARHKRSLNDIRLKIETLAYGLRMDALINTRQSKRILTTLVDFFDKAQALGYVGRYAIREGATPLGGVVEFSMVPGKVYYPKALQEAMLAGELPDVGDGAFDDEEEALNAPGQMDLLDQL